ncbi:MAG: 50S ribosomal protein L23 [Candidatus Magasanikbacteria bacterium GW2011_GWC2_37_14]|uniref:Large ribosomal subunit protein uL23 n=1 Tax=Candidatus Magasanikbacteria bacterium GW2011_GWC2_37_14 TaxID=1619046 RepID=A0A0G0JG54_9BACT|nr:MAG: 50S ribosomal protein L23 [Candidatus Magasanikbacteria bacterium GW2011_GWC2_37_14]
MGLLDHFKKDNKKEAANKFGQVSDRKNSVKNKTVKEKSGEEDKNVKDKEIVYDKRNIKVGNESYKALLKSIVSEKAAIAESHGSYTFKVNKDINKIQIKQAVASVYKVKPIKVRIINVDGKSVRTGRKTGRRSDWKKAIVTLAKGQSISIHEGV